MINVTTTYPKFKRVQTCCRKNNTLINFIVYKSKTKHCWRTCYRNRVTKTYFAYSTEYTRPVAMLDRLAWDGRALTSPEIGNLDRQLPCLPYSLWSDVYAQDL